MLLMGRVELLHLGDDATSAAGRRVCPTRSRREDVPSYGRAVTTGWLKLWLVTGEAPFPPLLIVFFLGASPG